VNHVDLSDRYDAATVLKQSDDLEGAVAALEAILADHPDHILSHSALAVYLVQLGREDDAVTHAIRVTELTPDDAFAFTQLAVVCQRCDRPQEAETAMRRAQQIAVGGVGEFEV